MKKLFVIVVLVMIMVLTGCTSDSPKVESVTHVTTTITGHDDGWNQLDQLETEYYVYGNENIGRIDISK